jgi:hypothetical protein
MNCIDFILRLHHPIASHNILIQWFRIFHQELLGEDDIYQIKISPEPVEKSKVVLIKIEFRTPMIFEEMIEFINYFIEFESSKIFTLYNQPVNIELYEDKISYNKELFYLQDLTIRNSRIKERLSELKLSWNQ